MLAIIIMVYVCLYTDEPTRQWILQKSVCLNVGYNELLTFALNGSFGDNCLSESLTINALPTVCIVLNVRDFKVHVWCCSL